MAAKITFAILCKNRENWILALSIMESRDQIWKKTSRCYIVRSASNDRLLCNMLNVYTSQSSSNAWRKEEKKRKEKKKKSKN